MRFSLANISILQQIKDHSNINTNDLYKIPVIRQQYHSQNSLSNACRRLADGGWVIPENKSTLINRHFCQFRITLEGEKILEQYTKPLLTMQKSISAPKAESKPVKPSIKERSISTDQIMLDYHDEWFSFVANLLKIKEPSDNSPGPSLKDTERIDNELKKIARILKKALKY